MSGVELVKTLIDMVNSLPNGDFGQLDAIRIRADMLIRNLFSATSQYLDQLASIRFRPNVSYVGQSRFDLEHWTEGKTRMQNLFGTMLEDLELFNSQPSSGALVINSQELSDQVFVVHGHDEEMKQAVARLLEKLDLKPLVLHEQPNQSRTIIEKFEDYSDVSFAVVLLSPDDMAYPSSESPDVARGRARQNVIFELGFFIGRLGRANVAVIHSQAKDFEMPTDYSGVLFIPYSTSGPWQLDLVKELKARGYAVDANRLLGDY